MEDDYFYLQPMGINPFRIAKATYYHIIKGSKKGNPSIAEQVFEFYIGKKHKDVFDKFIQILGAMYYTYYTRDREELINLYVQSIPGSFWGDHNFGVSSLVKSYLGKDNLECVSNRELAWMCRVGLLPTVVGKDYVRFYFLKEWYKERNIHIWDDRNIHYINKYHDKRLKSQRQIKLRCAK